MPVPLSALTVLTPAAWWALLTLFIPVLIHLFNRSRGRLVQIGHVDLIRRARKLRVTELKLAQWLLLLLRLGIFTLAALILTGLARQGLGSSTAATIYVTPAWLKIAGAAELSMLQTRTQDAAGTRVFLLETGFPQIDPRRLAAKTPPVVLSGHEVSSVWPLLAERLSLEHHEGPVTVYATDYALQFGSHKPSLPRDVNWQITPAAAAPAVINRPIHAVIAHSQGRDNEANLFGAALAALQQHRMPALTWDSIDASQIAEAQLNAGWLILLSDTGLSTAQLDLINTPTVILLDANGSDFENTRQFINLPFYPFSTFRLNRVSKADDASTQPAPLSSARVLVTTKDGDALLRQSQSGLARVLQFNSRFEAGWNSLTQQAEFPETLLALMLSADEQTQRFAEARINPVQLNNDNGESGIDVPLPQRSLQGLLALLLALLWVIERWLSERRPRASR